MHSVDIESREGQDVAIIGRLERVEDGAVVLKCAGREVRVKHQDIGSYKAGIVRVCGIVEDGVVVEKSVCSIGSEFDIETYGRLVNAAAKYQDIF
ncbi:replication protein A subunit RPA3-like protein [Encephalitozoon hellem ATCC 50504]|uniref:Replication protein A 14kDa subunit n=1 Tax=Encephalitozoon hellem TaxID=27973 RepID=A0A9Q9CCT3_ENCHE|nr:replication protein A subunit RPA3-like protein [Encephalitozoon hellem ATCC 50504]AFM98619.1 replication protein A subunit RPA3-like protein [Encephalitozoon hellem ATCC 50504]UTX43564.1 replication protein A 14kDa subunit [Encephalitozoon hellem]WEL39039.1 replication protein A 14kDa subunit [Encephalitozoon hellem]|eukprot:XP_003887600.1 replication protein A subunit RPA3-like protein [Encephalitozoon hellem ATCC 50504]